MITTQDIINISETLLVQAIELADNCHTRTRSMLEDIIFSIEDDLVEKYIGDKYQDFSHDDVSDLIGEYGLRDLQHCMINNLIEDNNNEEK